MPRCNSCDALIVTDASTFECPDCGHVNVKPVVPASALAAADGERAVLIAKAAKIDIEPPQRNIQNGTAYLQDQLWRRQLQLWPDSVQLTPQEVLEWACAAVSIDRCYSRLRAVCVALRYPIHVWYRIPKHGVVSGCRVGLHASDYLSGFSDL